MKKYKEIIIKTDKKTEEFKKLEKLVKNKKITKQEMEARLQKAYRAKGESYEKYA